MKLENLQQPLNQLSASPHDGKENKRSRWEALVQQALMGRLTEEESLELAAFDTHLVAAAMRAMPQHIADLCERGSAIRDAAQNAPAPQPPLPTHNRLSPEAPRHGQ